MWSRQGLGVAVSASDVAADHGDLLLVGGAVECEPQCGELRLDAVVRVAGSTGVYTRRSSRTRSLSTVNDRSQPIPSAITVPGR